VRRKGSPKASARDPRITTGQRIYGFVRVLAGLGFGVLAVIVATSKIPLIVRGVTTTGTVIEVDEALRPSRRTALVEFRDQSGARHQTRSTSGKYHVGDHLQIVYLPSDPRRAAEHSIATTWGALITLPLLSLFLMKAGSAIGTDPKTAQRARRR
jgi:hypothetical protein